MELKKINLNELYKVEDSLLVGYISGNPMDSEDPYKLPAVIICPGGAYQYCSKREAEPIAKRFIALGYQVFILYYTRGLDGAHYPEQLLELACSVDYIKKNSEELGVEKDNVFVVGFSAGGHLAGSLSTDYTLAQKEYGEKIDCKVKGAGLIYPVINDLYGHTMSHEVLFQNTDQSVRVNNPMRLDEMVNENTAPAFVLSTGEDVVVPAINSIKYVESLIKFNKEYELHIYKTGGHGMATFDYDTVPEPGDLDGFRGNSWFKDCDAFFKSLIK